MTCGARFAEAWQFAAFWCNARLLSRVDDSGGAGNAFLTDSQADFVVHGVEPNVGMILYNLTDGSSGVVTAVTETTITATLAGGTTNLWTDGDVYRITTLTNEEIVTIELYLDIAASDIHAAMAAQGMCNCALAGWATTFLQKLNIIDAASYYNCPCDHPKLTDEMRRTFLEWSDSQFMAIREGRIELCDGHTGKEYPDVGWAQYSFTERNYIQLIYDRLRRES